MSSSLKKDYQFHELPPEARQQYLEFVRLRNASKIGAQFKRKYKNDPGGFWRECFNWPANEAPADYQVEALETLVKERRLAIRSPHSTGKTAIAAVAVLWFALVNDGDDQADWKVVCTAGSWRQLKHYLFPEISKWARRLKWSKILRAPFTANELQKLSLSLTTGEAFAVASNDAGLIEGAHASRMFYLIDEGKTVADDVFDAIEGALASEGCYALVISTPGPPTGRFYQIHAKQPGLESWQTRHITLDEAIAAGRISPTWASEKKVLWGEQSAIYQNRVLGNFYANDTEGVIPLTWIELAIERWYEWKESGEWLAFTCLGADIGRSTDGDCTSLALRHEHVITELKRWSIADTMISSGHIASILKARGGYGVIDLIGIGAGVFDRLREQKFNVQGFNASGSAEGLTDRSEELEFVNLRAAAWWSVREQLDPAFEPIVCLPPDDRLIGDLCAPRYKYTSAGKIQIESKDEIRKRIGRSTNDGDSTVMALFSRPKRRITMY